MNTNFVIVFVGVITLAGCCVGAVLGFWFAWRCLRPGTPVLVKDREIADLEADEEQLKDDDGLDDDSLDEEVLADLRRKA